MKEAKTIRNKEVGIPACSHPRVMSALWAQTASMKEDLSF